jgi:3-phytase
MLCIRQHTTTTLLVALLVSLLTAAGPAQVVAVTPLVETTPVPSSGDAADDMAIWVHPTVPAQSLVIGTNKRAGIAVYDLAGSQLQYLADGELNNVDLRYGFPSVPGNAIVTSGERSQNVLAVYFVDANARRLVNVAARSIALGFAVYGCCMYRSHVTGDYYFFGTSASGHVEQWRLFATSAGFVDAARVRQFEVGSISEGCVADDENGWFFVSEENVGIWRYGAEPGAGTARVLVDATGSSGHLTADVEGLSIYYAAQGGGYLLASSQGSSTFVVYQRAAPHAYLRTFQITANAALGIDAVSGTDGIDVANIGLGSNFPGGVFIAQDDSNPGANQNFKLVSWTDVANSANPPLLVDSTFDVHGALCPPAAWSYRNGAGGNPQILTNQLPPVLGATWSSTLDCTGSSPGVAVIAVFGRPGAGFFVGPYEVLVDLSSPFLFSLSSPQASNAVPFSVPVPGNLGLCGMQVSVQGACVDAQLVLSNAIDLTLGR